MHDPTFSDRQDAVLHALVTGVIAGIQTSLESVMPFRRVSAKPARLPVCMDIEGWLWLLEDTLAVMRGSLEQPIPGSEVLFGFDAPAAITLAGGLMSTPRVVLQQHLDEGLLEWHDEALVEIGNILCSGANRVLRQQLEFTAGLRFRDYAPVRPGFDQAGILGQGDKVVYEYALEIDDFPKSAAFVILDAELAKVWNGNVAPQGGGISFGAVGGGFGPGLQRGRAPEVADARCSTLAAYVVGADSGSVVQACAERLGLEYRRRPSTEVPNPAAHRGDLVVIEVPVGEEKRFEWARRLKEQRADTLTVLLIHEPSRARVIQGCMTKADAVVAWPSMEPQLTEKLAAVVARAPKPS